MRSSGIATAILTVRVYIRNVMANFRQARAVSYFCMVHMFAASSDPRTDEVAYGIGDSSYLSSRKLLL